MDKDFEFLLKLMEPDTVFIPKGVLKLRVSDEAIFIFADIVTDNRFGTIGDVKSDIDNVPDSLIAAYAEYSEKMGKKRTASKIKADLRKIRDNLEFIFTYT